MAEKASRKVSGNLSNIVNRKREIPKLLLIIVMKFLLWSSQCADPARKRLQTCAKNQEHYPEQGNRRTG